MKAELIIRYEKGKVGDYSGEIKAHFNPSQLAYSRSANWSPVVYLEKSRPGFALDYRSSAPETLTLELFFDSYEDTGEEQGLPGQKPPSARKSVFETTQAIADLARAVPELGRPAICRLEWGKNPTFQCVLQQSTRTLQLFLEDGTPVRATMNCTFMEFPDRGPPPAQLDSPVEPKGPVTRPADTLVGGGTTPAGGTLLWKQYTVRPGDTLSGIAATQYGNSSLWRRIADANRIENPLLLTPGRTLAIPPPP